jgi:ferredoxin-NADP reductase
MQLVLIDKREVAESTMAFRFQPQEPLSFEAGQFGEFTLDPDRSDYSSDNIHIFSFAGSPNNQEIMIATRMRDSIFKKTLAQLPAGGAIEVMGPMGNFILPEDESMPVILLAGGIGVTPIRSMIEFATQQRSRRDIYFFYANRTLAATAFHNDFLGWQKNNSRLHYVPTLTDEPPAEWIHETGRFNWPMLQHHVPPINSALFYVVGPPAMVQSTVQLLEKNGVGPERIKQEDFSGY